MTKNQIIQTYNQALTIRELEEVGEKHYKDYAKLLSWDQGQVKGVFKKRIKELN